MHQISRKRYAEKQFTRVAELLQLLQSGGGTANTGLKSCLHRRTLSCLHIHILYQEQEKKKTHHPSKKGTLFKKGGTFFIYFQGLFSGTFINGVALPPLLSFSLLGGHSSPPRKGRRRGHFSLFPLSPPPAKSHSCNAVNGMGV